MSGTEGNVSAREGELVHITPSALPYPELTVDDLVTLGLDGEVVAGRREPSSERRVHLAVYAARPDARALVHTHSRHATAWSLRGEPLGDIRTAAYAPSGSDEIAAAAVEALGGRPAVLLERHGVLGVGGSPSDALEVCVQLERRALLGGGSVTKRTQA